MALKLIKYTTTAKLSCACSFPADVALCVTSSKVAPHLCSDATNQTWEYSYIDAILTDVSNTCGSCNFTYTFSYDDALVTETLLSSDIQGIVCKDCEITYIQDLIGGEVEFTSEDDGSITVHTQHGCTFNFFPGESSLSVTDTNSINLTLTAGVSKILTADVKLSADAGNEIEIRADGLFADFSASFTPAADGTTDLGTALLRFRNLYLSDSIRFANNTYAQWRNAANSAWLNAVKVDASDDLILNASTGNEIRFEINELERWGISSAGELEQNGTNGSDIVFNLADGIIRQNTTDGFDTASLSLLGGAGLSASRGGKVQVYGNEHATRGGWAVLNAGQAANALAYVTADGVTTGRVTLSAGATGFIEAGCGGTTGFYLYNNGVLQYNFADTKIVPTTTLGADTFKLTVGNVDRTRGAIVTLKGNQHAANPGNLELRSGDLSSADVTIEASDDIIFVGASLNMCRISGPDHWMSFEQADFKIRAETNNNFDTYELGLAGGGQTTSDRGAYLTLAGNEHANAGKALLSSGNGAGSIVQLSAPSSTSTVDIELFGSVQFQFANSGSFIFNNDTKIKAGTIDTADNKFLAVCGGGNNTASRGAYALFYGNEAGSPGNLELRTGDAANALLRLVIEDSGSAVTIEDATTGVLWSFEDNGNLTQNASNGGNILFQRANKSISDHVTTAIAAAGATQGTATAIADIVNVVTTVAAGADGVVLPTAVAGVGYYVFNDDSADTLNVYPPVGGEINRLGTNVAFTLATGVGVLFKAFSTTEFFTV